jgi:hypothetical protein
VASQASLFNVITHCSASAAVYYKYKYTGETIETVDCALSEPLGGGGGSAKSRHSGHYVSSKVKTNTDGIKKTFLPDLTPSAGEVPSRKAAAITGRDARLEIMRRQQ